MLRKTILGKLAVVVFGVLVSLTFGKTATVSAQSPYTVDSNLTISAGVTGTQIDEAIRKIRADSPLIGLGNNFVDVGNRYGINAIYMVAHAAWESTWGTSQLARNKNNLFGYGAYDRCPYDCAWTFASKQECIEKVFPIIKAQYLTPGGSYYTSDGPTLRGMNRNYATDQNWKNGIASIMNSLSANIGSNPVVSPPPPSLPPEVQKPIDDLIKQIQQKLDELQTQLRKEVETFIQREIDRIIRETCGVPGVVLVLVALVAVNRKRKI